MLSDGDKAMKGKRLEDEQAALRQRLRKLTKPKDRKAPAEVAAVQGQLASPDGRFRFRPRWYVRVGQGDNVVYSDVSLSTVWSAGTIEEMLHAIAAAELVMAQVPGVRQEFKWAGLRGLKRCANCHRLIGPGRYHDLEYCQAVRMAKAAKRLAKRGVSHG
jgi:hypothetical protein